MDRQELYNTWKTQRPDIQVPPDFPDQVMNQIQQFEQNRPKPIFDLEPLLQRLTTHLLVRVGLVAAALMLGLGRATITLLVSLG